MDEERLIQPPFNRTSLELKLDRIVSSSQRLHPFNRTSLELKHNPNRHIGLGRATFNRTSLELKLCPPIETSITHTQLLIEPVWN